MYEYLIYSRLKKYAKAKKSFHMPGHKACKEFKSKFGDASIDVTELSYSDNLHCPEGVIAEAQKDIAEILGAKKSYITTDGSSSGVYTMLYCASKRGKKVIVPRNSHLSVWNACKLFGLEPVIVQGKEAEGVLLPPTAEELEAILSKGTNIGGILVTSPDYYGNIAPLAEYRSIAERHNSILMVDGAHGAHLAFGDRKAYAGEYADIWVDGAHKTLPVLTQGAVINVKNEELIPDAEEALSLFRTTSPSYPIMASVEFGIKFLANNTRYIYEAKSCVEELKYSSDAPFKLYENGDWTKLVIDFKPLGVNSDKIAAKLEKKGIYPEFSDGRYILFYLSPMTRVSDINLLKKRLVPLILGKRFKGSYKERPQIPEVERSYGFQYALGRQNEWVPLKEAEGRVCAGNAGFNPPCIPVIVMGETITAEAIKALLQTKATFGIKDGKICVVKKW